MIGLSILTPNIAEIDFREHYHQADNHKHQQEKHIATFFPRLQDL